jgi:hypothetical protein
MDSAPGGIAGGRILRICEENCMNGFSEKAKTGVRIASPTRFTIANCMACLPKGLEREAAVNESALAATLQIPINEVRRLNVPKSTIAPIVPTMRNLINLENSLRNRGEGGIIDDL